MEPLTSVEICAGAGGQALGLEQAGFAHQGVVELDADACQTLRRNRATRWTVIQADLAEVDGRGFGPVDLLAGGLPCPPFSIAGKQLGHHDQRDLFPQALRLVEQTRPRAVLLENVPGLAARRFDGYRAQILRRLHALGYHTWWHLVQASQYSVPQLRPRFVLVAIKPPWAARFRWPGPAPEPPPTVGQALGDLMGSRGWPGAPAWAQQARQIAPTIVGGSTKHGGPDLGPTRARQAWTTLGVDGRGIADHPPGPAHPAGQPPRLTIPMVARLQGFPDSWEFSGRKTAAYRQVGNAFPPPAARALGTAIAAALTQAPPPPGSRPRPPAACSSASADRRDHILSETRAVAAQPHPALPPGHGPFAGTQGASTRRRARRMTNDLHHVTKLRDMAGREGGREATVVAELVQCAGTENRAVIQPADMPKRRPARGRVRGRG